MSFDYEAIEREEAPQALRLCRWVMRHLQPRKVLDLGCATGFYLAPFQAYGLTDLLGFESNPGALKVARARYPAILFQEVDLSKPKPGTPVWSRCDLGICLEVAEHIPEEAEGALCENLRNHCRTVIFGAAQPGQGGEGHINCKPRAYWVDKLRQHGLHYDAEESESMLGYMRSGYHLGWIRNAFVATGTY